MIYNYVINIAVSGFYYIEIYQSNMLYTLNSYSVTCQIYSVKNILKIYLYLGCLNLFYFKDGRLGGSVGWASDFSSGHDLVVCGFEPRIGLCADSSEPGACFGSRESPSVSAPPHSYFVSVSLKNKQTLKKNFF